MEAEIMKKKFLGIILVVVCVFPFLSTWNVSSANGIDDFIVRYNQAAANEYKKELYLTKKVYSPKDRSTYIVVGENEYILKLNNDASIVETVFKNGALSFNFVDVSRFILMGMGCSNMLLAANSLNRLLDDLNSKFGMSGGMGIDSFNDTGIKSNFFLSLSQDFDITNISAGQTFSFQVIKRGL